MPDGGEALLTGTILGQLSVIMGANYPIKILNAAPIMDADGNYRNTFRVEMASGTYYVTVTDYDPALPTTLILEEP